MNKAEFLERQRQARAEWESLLAQVGPERMARPGTAGYWSVRDVIAHVAWFEREMLGMLRARALEGSELWDLDQDARNAVVYEQNRERPVDDVLAEARRVYAELLPLLEGMSDEDYEDASRFRGMPPAWAPWRVIAGNTWEHYEAHMPAIRAALESQAVSSSPDARTSLDQNKTAFRRLVASWTGDLAEADELVAPGYVLHVSEGDLDVEGMKRRTRALRDRLPDIAFTIEDQFAEGDRVATRMSAAGTSAESDKRERLTGVSIGRFAGGRLAEEWAVWETLPEEGKK